MPVALRTKKIITKPANPQADPRFKSVKNKIAQNAQKVKKHPPAKQKAVEAAKAAKGPPNEKTAGAKANQVDVMKAAEPEAVKTESFLSILQAEIQKVMPKTMGDTENFMEGGEQAQMKAAVSGEAAEQKDAASADIDSATKKAPDPSGVQAKTAAAIPPDAPTPAPSVNAAAGMPAPTPDAEISQQQNKTDSEKALKENKITPGQLQKANDPRFSAVLSTKDNVGRVSDSAPANYRGKEKTALSKGQTQAQGQTATGMSALANIKVLSNSAVKSRQESAKKTDEDRRQKVTKDIEKIYDDTKATVEQNLNTLEADVVAIFDAGAASAIANFKADCQREIDDFKSKQGIIDWFKEKLKLVPPEIPRILDRNLVKFEKKLMTLAEKVAGLVDRRLAKAKTDIEKGQGKIKAYVAALPKDLQKVGQAAEESFSSRFDEMKQGIEDKKNDLAQKLAQRYREAYDQAKNARDQLEQENKDAFDKFAEAVGDVIKILTEFKDKLMAILRKGADTIELILKDPIGFLGNLIAALKAGVGQFVANIWTHLKAGFMKWLFGALSGAGIEIPADFSPTSLFKMVMSVLGLTIPRLRAKAVKLLGPAAVAVIEKLIEYVTILITGGPAKLWEQIKSDVGDLKVMIIDAIQSWIVSTIIKQAAIKLVSFINPAGAIVQAVMAIYNGVMFIIERAAQIMEFVEAVINSVSSIAQGAIGAAANWIEKSLGNMIPLVIGFLARLIGLGGISQKIKEFITKVQTKVDKAIDKAIAKIVEKVKKLIGKLTGKGKAKGKDKEKDKKDSEDVKTKVENYVKPKLDGIEDGAKAQSVMNDAYRTYKKDGLKMIHVVQGSYADEFEVHAVASPGKKVGMIKTHLKLNVKDLDLSEPSTALTATLNSKDLGRKQSGGGSHAEERLINGTLKPNWENWIKTGKAEHYQLTININRSPCGNKTADEPDNHNCATQLVGFFGWAQKIAKKHKKTASMKLNIASLYGGQRSGEDSPAQMGLHELLDAGVEIGAWDIVKALEKKGVKNINAAAKKAGIRQKLTKRKDAFKDTLKKIKKAKAGS